MGTEKVTTRRPGQAEQPVGDLSRYACGPVHFSGREDGLFERHIMFDNVIDPAAAEPRDCYEAVARSVRDVLSQRGLLTEQTYEAANAKRIYYLSMEFLIGRSLANNVMNLPAARAREGH